MIKLIEPSSLEKAFYRNYCANCHGYNRKGIQYIAIAVSGSREEPGGGIVAFALPE